MTRPVPFKVCIPSRGPARIGVAAHSYGHLCDVVRQKYRVRGDFYFQQEDGTIVCDEDYFRLLEPKTLLTVVEARVSAANPNPATPSSCGPSLGSKRPTQMEPTTAAPPPPPCKRPHLNTTHPSYPSTIMQQQQQQYRQQQQHYLPQAWATGAHMRQAPPPSQPVHVPSNVAPPPSSLSTLRPVQMCGSPLSGVIPLARNGGTGLVLSPPRNLPANYSANNNTAPPLVSQLQITNVMGNVNMSPPTQTTPPTATASPIPPSPQPNTVVVSPPRNIPAGYTVYRVPARFAQPHCTHLQPSAYPYQYACPHTVPIHRYCVPQASPLHSANHLPPAALNRQWQQNSQMGCEQTYANNIQAMTLREYQADMALLQRTVENLHHRRPNQPPPPHPPPPATVPTSIPPCVPLPPATVPTSNQPAPCVLPPQLSTETNYYPADGGTQNCYPSPTLLGAGPPLVENTVSSPGENIRAVNNGEMEMENEETDAIDMTGYSVSPPSVAVVDGSTDTEPSDVEVVVQTVEAATETEPDAVKVKQAHKTVQVMSFPPENDSLFAGRECDEEEEEEEDDDNKLCIIEQTFSPTSPQPPPTPSQDTTPTAAAAAAAAVTTRGTRSKPPALFHVPYVNSPRPKPLGDAKYPIIIDTDPTTAAGKEHGKSIVEHSPDEGYSSSSSSPLEATQDFTLQLPFANYDSETRADITNGGKFTGEKRADKRSTSAERSAVDDRVIDSNQEALEQEFIGEEYEEDFVMDIDVFSPSPTKAATTTPATSLVKRHPHQPELPEYIPLEMANDSTTDDDFTGTGVEDGAKRKLIVSISRDSLSSVSSITSLLNAPRSLSTRSQSTHSQSTRSRFRRFIKCTPAAPMPRRQFASSLRRCISLDEETWTVPPVRPHARKRKHRHSTTSITRHHKPMIVSIPIVGSGGGGGGDGGGGGGGGYGCSRQCLVSIEDSTEDSDEPATAMELLASRLEETAQLTAAAASPRIVHLQSHCGSDAEEDGGAVVESRAIVSPATCKSPVLLQVAEYCCEVNVPSVCSVDDVSSCVRELSDICCRCGPDDRSSVATLDVGDEIELGAMSQESSGSVEMTGMELLNLTAEHCCSPVRPKKSEHYCSSQCTSHSVSKVYCENLATQLKEKLNQPEHWKVHSLSGHTGDPRHRIQRYSFGDKAFFELSCSSGRWNLTTFA